MLSEASLEFLLERLRDFAQFEYSFNPSPDQLVEVCEAAVKLFASLDSGTDTKIVRNIYINSGLRYFMKTLCLSRIFCTTERRSRDYFMKRCATNTVKDKQKRRLFQTNHPSQEQMKPKFNNWSRFSNHVYWRNRNTKFLIKWKHRRWFGKRQMRTIVNFSINASICIVLTQIW